MPRRFALRPPPSPSNICSITLVDKGNKWEAMVIYMKKVWKKGPDFNLDLNYWFFMLVLNR